jgi:hypothetical protein
LSHVLNKDDDREEKFLGKQIRNAFKEELLSGDSGIGFAMALGRL